MEVPDKLLGSEVKALMNVRQQPESGQQNEQSFRRFKDGYDTKTAFYSLTFHTFSQRAPPVRKTPVTGRPHGAASSTLS
jgi:hypothetical protein